MITFTKQYSISTTFKEDKQTKTKYMVVPLVSRLLKHRPLKLRGERTLSCCRYTCLGLTPALSWDTPPYQSALFEVPSPTALSSVLLVLLRAKPGLESGSASSWLLHFISRPKWSFHLLLLQGMEGENYPSVLLFQLLLIRNTCHGFDSSLNEILWCGNTWKRCCWRGLLTQSSHRNNNAVSLQPDGKTNHSSAAFQCLIVIGWSAALPHLSRFYLFFWKKYFWQTKTVWIWS